MGMQSHGYNYIPEHHYLCVEKVGITIITTTKIQCVLLFLG